MKRLCLEGLNPVFKFAKFYPYKLVNKISVMESNPKPMNSNYNKLGTQSLLLIAKTIADAFREIHLHFIRAQLTRAYGIEVYPQDECIQLKAYSTILCLHKVSASKHVSQLHYQEPLLSRQLTRTTCKEMTVGALTS